MELDEDGDLVLQRRASNAPGDQISQNLDDELVLSEVHMEQDCPRNASSMVTKFWHGEQVLEVQHGFATPLARVGLQVWRGALLLGDYILQSQHLFSGCTVLELGAGPGVSGMLAAASAQLVFLTDVGPETLHNCHANVARNAARLQGGPEAVRVRELDWLAPPDWLAAGSRGSNDGSAVQASPAAAAAQQQGRDGPLAEQQQQGRQRQEGQQGQKEPLAEQQPLEGHKGNDGEAFSWQPADVAALAGLHYLLAADIIYDNDLTEAFMRCAVALLRHAVYGGAQRAQHGSSGGSHAQQTQQQPRLLVALERRVNFTLRDMEPVAPAYDYWRGLFIESQGKGLQDSPSEGATGGGTQPKTAMQASAEAVCRGSRLSVSPLAEEEPLRQLDGGQARSAPQGGGAAKAVLPLVGRQIEVESIPQQLHSYERSDYLELWELWLSE